MEPRPDYGEESYQGYGRRAGKVALITGADSGIGRAVALAFTREGADVLIAYLNEEVDARETVRVVEAARRKAIAVTGDIGDEAHCRELVERAVREFGYLDILVNNAAFQMSHQGLEDLPSSSAHAFLRADTAALPAARQCSQPRHPFPAPATGSGERMSQFRCHEVHRPCGALLLGAGNLAGPGQ